ncbi:hypothetical protein [Propionivibrio sp.]|uniref:hypothetical protein n=1 Tax=Propionivibrio sp. TaxID=2212460 RepID=UPI003BF58310
MLVATLGRFVIPVGSADALESPRYYSGYVIRASIGNRQRERARKAWTKKRRLEPGFSRFPDAVSGFLMISDGRLAGVVYARSLAQAFFSESTLEAAWIGDLQGVAVKDGVNTGSYGMARLDRQLAGVADPLF